jgi:hypothetical protein
MTKRVTDRHESTVHPARRSALSAAVRGRSGLVLLSAATALVAGCSTVYENKYEFRDGWRKGEVVRITVGEAIQRPVFWNCTRKTTAEQRSGRQYAVVAYRQVPYRPRQHLVPLPSGVLLHPGQRVYVNVGTCENAIALPRGIAMLQGAAAT